jgi:hypothetical protein
MLVLNYILLFVIIIIMLMLLQRYYDKKEILENKERMQSIHHYLLSETSLVKNKKPLLWIHIPYEFNSRNWLDFNSRKTLELNQPYLYLTIQSIIQNCDDSFNICLIDDHSFSKIIPNWKVDMKLISDPLLVYMRQLAMAKLIYTYGGMVVPISFLCFKNLHELYKKGTRNNKMFLCENINNNITSTSYNFYPDLQFMGSVKNNKMVEGLIQFIERTISKDYTAQLKFEGEFNRWCNTRIYNKEINLIDGKEIGIKTLDDDKVLVDDLLNEDYLNFFKEMYGILIPSNMILTRKKYEWFARLSTEQVLDANTILSKYMLIALSPDSKNGVVELKESKPNWVNFWSVPSSAPVYGLKPNHLGDKIQPLKF